MKTPFILNVILPEEEVCMKVMPTQTLSRVMSAIKQKYSLEPAKNWLLVLCHGHRKLSLEESLKNHSTLESVGIASTKEIQLTET